MSSAPASARIGRAVLLGLCMGFLAGAVVLATQAWKAHAPSCENLSEQECALIQEMAPLHARSQALAALALIFLAGACGVMLRRRPNPGESPK